MPLMVIITLRGSENAVDRFDYLASGVGLHAVALPPMRSCVIDPRTDTDARGTCLPCRNYPYNFSRSRAYGRSACPRPVNGTVFGFFWRRDARADSFS